MMHPGPELEGEKDGGRISKIFKERISVKRDSNWSTTLPVDGP